MSRAYHRALGNRKIDPELAETLARRMIAFEGEYGAASPLLVETLQRMLEIVPGARWAIDRVKLVLGSQARWDELFRIYDRAIDVAADQKARTDLLGEAAFAAKDLAARPERAIVYFEEIHALRPEDPAVDAALERLYEKQGQTGALIKLLNARLDRCTGFQRRELLRKIAWLWADLGSADEAIAIVDRMLSDGAPVADMTELLERLADPDLALGRAPDGESAPDADAFIVAQKRAIALLRAHYEAASQIDDVVRMSERELALAVGAEDRARCVRDLVALRIAAAERSTPARRLRASWSRASRSTWRATRRCRRSRSRRSFSERSAPGSNPPRRPATTRPRERGGSSTSSRSCWWSSGKGEAALHLLTRCSRLPFERARRRELVREAALVCADRLADPARAIATFGELFQEDGGDEVAAKSLERFAALLEAAGELPRLAALWESQSEVNAKAGKTAEERACWECAARLWERQDETEKAVAAYGRAGALGSMASFEALAQDPLRARSVGRSRRGARVARRVTPPPRRAGFAPCSSRRRASRSAIAAARARTSRARSPRGSRPSAPSRSPSGSSPSTARTRRGGRSRAFSRPRRAAPAIPSDGSPGCAKRPTSTGTSCKSRRRRRRSCSSPCRGTRATRRSGPRSPTCSRRRASGTRRPAFCASRSPRTASSDRRSGRASITGWRTRSRRRAEPDGALAELRLAAEMHPAHPAILYDLGRAALSSGKLDLAESTFRALLLALHHTIDEADAGPPGPASRRGARGAQRGRGVQGRPRARRRSRRLRGRRGARERRGPEALRGPSRARAAATNCLRDRWSVAWSEAATLAARASALGDLASLWEEHLASLAPTCSRASSATPSACTASSSRTGSPTPRRGPRSRRCIGRSATKPRASAWCSGALRCSRPRFRT